MKMHTWMVMIVVGLLLTSMIAPPAATAQGTALPSITTVADIAGEQAWAVSFDNGVTVNVGVRVLETGGKAPALGPVQVYQDNRICIPYVGCGLRYLVFTDGAGVTYKGS
jgi:hypothetical protein